MEIISTRVDTQKALYLPLEETVIMPVGDIHYSGGGDNDPCDVDRFKRHLEWGMKRKAYFLGMGDGLDIMSPSNRKALLRADLYDSTQDLIENMGGALVEKFLQLVKGTEDRWLGWLQGHHYYEFEDGTTSDTRICQALRAPFLGDCAFVRLNFIGPVGPEAAARRTEKQGARPIVAKRNIKAGCTIWCHHGTGGGRLVSAPLNLLEHVIKVFEADIYLIGHQHKKVAAPMDRIYVNWRTRSPSLRHRRVIIACTGGFLRGYMQGIRRQGRSQGTYVEKRLLSPTALGGIAIYARPRRDTREGMDRYHLDLGVEQ